MESEVILVEGLTKHYGPRVGVKGLSLRVPKGCVFGFIGPNGAGKTTTIRLLLGFLRPGAGRAQIFGRDCWRESHLIKREVGYVPGDLRLHPWMTGVDALVVTGRARGLDLAPSGRELASYFELDLTVRVRSMSRGMRQKLGLILALVHEPSLLVLDEPTSSLDPLAQDRLYRRLRALAERGHTVFFSSHVLSEVQDLCDRVAIVRSGVLVADETLETLRSRAKREVAGAALLARGPSGRRPDDRAPGSRQPVQALLRGGGGRRMNRGLWTKGVREVWPGTLLFALGLLGFEVVLGAVLPTFFTDRVQSLFVEIPFIRNVLRALIGADVGAEFGFLAVSALAWVHPVVLALISAHVIVFCTRMPVGEIDRGTVDVLLSLPVSRWQAYVTETVVWIVSGMAVLLAGLIGNTLGRLAAPPQYSPDLGRLLVVLANLFCLYLAVGGVAYFVSACSERRGRAVGTVFAIVLGSFFLHVLGQFWRPAESFQFLGLMHYYRPFELLQSGAVPVLDMLVLVAFAAVFWIGGGWVFARRDICTV
jgi:ABC-2 type transport system ATP-binding protein